MFASPCTRSWYLGASLLALTLWAGISGDQPAARGQDESGGAAVEKPAIARAAPANTPAADRLPPGPETPDSGSDGDETEEAANPVESSGISPGMAALFPVGRIFQGVRIPSYSGDSLSSVVHAEYMKRADEEHLEMEMLEIVVYDGGEPDTRILTDRAIYDTVAKTLRSTTPGRIMNSQFEMQGDRMVFDSASRIGHLTGNVKTKIFNPEGLQSGTAKSSDIPPTPPSQPE